MRQNFQFFVSKNEIGGLVKQQAMEIYIEKAEDWPEVLQTGIMHRLVLEYMTSKYFFKS